MLEFACVSVIFNEMTDQSLVMSPVGSQPTGIPCTCTLQSTHVSFLLNPHLFFR